ncbi:signal transduction histidine kinase [Flavobacterium arsenatis]|uniref:histidine kinase n=1 Tax=Flavobacterium arsenatis TaxID=1484332 RepID=A0ABU1TJH5_9FLAO|nr:ATP-binding protein [Flavobacterium arsenatis]MDR6966139.1 signal transduction histidine kinase [Flavobacterium arsenatis]
MNTNFAFGIIIVVLFASLVVLFCVLLGKLYINKIKNYTKVIYQKDIDFQKTLNTTIIETQEQVLNNISQDLHDDAGQQLTYINFQIENLKLDSPLLKETLEPLSQSVSNLSKSIRSISHSLNNQFITKQNLLKVIETEVERLQKNPSIHFHFLKTDAIEKTFTTNEKIVIYRIFQEIINNAFKHSKATEITITIRNKNGFSMTISDNGKGFDYELVKESTTSLGLKNITARASIIDYAIEVQSEPEKGTTIILSENKNI